MEACSGLRNAKSSLVLDDFEEYEVERNRYYTMGEDAPQGSYHGKFEEQDPSRECVRFSALATQSSKGHTRQASGNKMMPIDDVHICEHQFNTLKIIL